MKSQVILNSIISYKKEKKIGNRLSLSAYGLQHINLTNDGKVEQARKARGLLWRVF